jgi:plasmid maintenance system antidote protein VapI
VPIDNRIERRSSRVDPVVWTRIDMREALAVRDIAGVYRILQRFGMSQRRIAALTDQSQSEVSEIIAGRRVVISYDLLVRICDGLGSRVAGWASLQRRVRCPYRRSEVTSLVWLQEVMMTSSNAEPLPELPSSDHVPIAELARRQGVGPILSVDELARPGTFESDEELNEFLADLYESRRADVA